MKALDLRNSINTAVDAEKDNKNQTNWKWVGIGALIILVVLSILALFMYIRKRSRNKSQLLVKNALADAEKEINQEDRNHDNNDGSNFLKQSGSDYGRMTGGMMRVSIKQKARQFSLKELKAATHKFNDECLIGSGGFGLVYKAVLENGKMVAIKRAREESVQGSEEFRNEVELLSRVRHKHLVNLIGFCEELGEQILVYEFVPNGSLLDHIAGEKGPLTWRQRIKIAIEASKGLAYLHEGCSPGIIHRDVKPSNILLTNDYEAKVSDFGLSKDGPTGSATHVSTIVKGTLGYLDPHYYLTFHLTPSSDVYSFGVILLQLVTARPAVDHSRKRSEYNIINWAAASIESGRLEDIVDPCLMIQGYDREVMLTIVKLGLRCTQRDAKKRPSMSSICQELEDALLKVEHNVNPISDSISRDSDCSSCQAAVSFSQIPLDVQRFKVASNGLSLINDSPQEDMSRRKRHNQSFR